MIGGALVSDALIPFLMSLNQIRFLKTLDSLHQSESRVRSGLRATTRGLTCFAQKSYMFSIINPQSN